MPAHAETVGQWTVTDPPTSTTTNETLTGVTSISAKDAWAVGSTFDGTGHSSTVATRWNGRRRLAAQSVGEGAFTASRRQGRVGGRQPELLAGHVNRRTGG